MKSWRPQARFEFKKNISDTFLQNELVGKAEIIHKKHIYATKLKANIYSEN